MYNLIIDKDECKNFTVLKVVRRNFLKIPPAIGEKRTKIAFIFESLLGEQIAFGHN